jgi:hypothetical protein
MSSGVPEKKVITMRKKIKFFNPAGYNILLWLYEGSTEGPGP